MASDRITWAVAQLDPQPDDAVLELGCGQGAALELLAGRVQRLVGIDRSAKMTLLAARHAEVHTAAVHEADLGDERFTKVLAIRFPPLLRGDPSRELALVREHLAPGGRLYVAGGGERESVAAVRERLAGFTVLEERVEPTRFCVVAG